MPSTTYLVSATFLLFLIILGTRSLPFLFAKKMQGNYLFEYLGSRLPICITFILVINYVIAMAKPMHWHTLPWHFCGLLAALLCHWYWRNMIISLFVGSGIFLFLSAWF